MQLISFDVAIAAGGLRFDYRLDQIGHSVVSCSPLLRHFFGAVLNKRKAAEMVAAARYTLRRNTASIMKV